MTEPVDDDSSYPEQWKPRERRQRDAAIEPLAAEAWLAAMDPAERAAMLRRIEAMK